MIIHLQTQLSDNKLVWKHGGDGRVYVRDEGGEEDNDRIELATENYIHE